MKMQKKYIIIHGIAVILLFNLAIALNISDMFKKTKKKEK